MANTDKDQRFAARIQSGIQTAEAWDDDPSLLAECRLMIPFSELMPELVSNENENNTGITDSPFESDKDYMYQGNVLFLKRLTVYFQKEMTWVNQPPCRNCKSTEHMKAQETRGPQSQEEHEGQANRVEVFECQACSSNNAEPVVTTFPRYNSVRKLLETKSGRCGEYANLFGLHCRAAGFETRYVSDWTDHVWVEVWCGSEWIMADGCEGIIQEPSIYEHGWGKKLNYVVAIQAGGGVADVTPRYTRKYNNPEFQERRRQVASSEAVSDQIIRRFHKRMIQNLPTKRKEELNRRQRIEEAQLDKWKNITEWSEAEKHGQGRISGSLEWRIQRNEVGTNENSMTKNKASSVALSVEQFYPYLTDRSVSIAVSPKPQAGILVSGANCDVGQPHCISAVVVDDARLGCILQSRSFPRWSDLAAFLQAVPLGRIVVLKGNTDEDAFPENLENQMGVLGGFYLPDEPSEGVLYIGRRISGGNPPDWTRCTTYKMKECSELLVEFCDSSRSETKLRAEPKRVPNWILGRLPESVMPLQTQLLATDAQKRVAFLSYAETNPSVLGYTTKNNCPVYLMNNSSFPFLETPGDWATFHFLPEILVPECNDAAADPTTNAPNFDVPLEENFFSVLLGPSLLLKTNGSETATLPILDALRHTRLIGLYFSAHWCPPCKKFTPMLIEAYEHLKASFVHHGFEIIFVSSDRSTAEFNQYYASMPWAAVPYDETRMRQQGISMQFGVRGIPAMVILDAISGQVVSSIEQARNEVSQGCSRGDTGIEATFHSWISRLPTESRELFDLLQISALEGAAEDATNSPSPMDAYLTRNAELANPWTKADGTPPLKNLKANMLPNERIDPPALVRGDDAKIVLEIVLKYVDNALLEPWNSKFRTFKMSNRIVDKATRIQGSVHLICSLGMLVTPTTEDFVVSIPLWADLDHLRASLTKALAESGRS